MKRQLISVGLGAVLAFGIAACTTEDLDVADPVAAPAVSSAQPIPVAAPIVPTTSTPSRVDEDEDDVETTTESEVIEPESDIKCTDQIDYSADSRSNAELNSIGADTGSCPEVEPADSRAIELPDGSTGRIPNYLPSWEDAGKDTVSERTSGDEQFEWGCEQGYITEGC